VKISTLTLSTHASSSLAGALALAIAYWISAGFFLSIFVLVVVGIVIFFASRLLSSKVRICLQHFEEAVATGKESELDYVHIKEFDEATERLRELVQRWTLAATRSREQTRGIEQLVRQIDRRAEDRGGETSLGDRLRQTLTGITRDATRNLTQIHAGIAELKTSIRDFSQATDGQHDAISKAAAYVEHLSESIALVTEGAHVVESDTHGISDASREAKELLETLVRRVKNTREGVQACENRLRSLCEHFREITSITETMGEIASQTDMLALNVSIESVRAGQNGRGFSVVAEEVRKLAEHASQAAREVTGLVESMQLETQESISAIVQQGADLSEQVERLSLSQRAVDQLYAISTKTGGHLDEITKTVTRQVHLTQELVSVVERITKLSRNHRGWAEGTMWTVCSLDKVTEQFDSLLDLLRRALGLTDSRPIHPDSPTNLSQRGGTPDRSVPERSEEVAAACAR
jgi:methyl-accepting chemotaxis protein